MRTTLLLVFILLLSSCERIIEQNQFNPDSALENKQSQRDDLIKDRMKSY